MNFRLLMLSLLAMQFLYACNGSETDRTNMPASYTNQTVAAYTDKIAQNPNDPEAYYERAMALANIQSDSLSKVDFEKAISIDVANFKYNYRYANFLFEIKEFEKAAEQYEVLIKLDPKSEDAVLGIIQTYIKLNDARNANKYLEPPLRSLPGNPVLVFFTAEIALIEKDTTKAISILDGLLKEDQGHYEANFLKGVILSARNDAGNIRYFEKAFQLDTLDALPIEQIGDFYFARKDYVNALKYYKQTVRADNNYEYGFYKAGKTYFEMDSMDKSVNSFNIAIQSNLRYLDAYLGKAAAFEKMNLSDSALFTYEQALLLYPNSQSAKAGVTKLSKK